MTTEPVPAGAPLPHRKEIRGWLVPLATRQTLRPILLLAFDYLLLLTALDGALWLAPWWARLACGLAAGFVIGRLFIMGHDACLQSLTPHRRLNPWLGRIAFLPSLTNSERSRPCGAGWTARTAAAGAQVRAIAAGTHAARAHRHPALLVALVLRHGAALQAP